MYDEEFLESIIKNPRYGSLYSDGRELSYPIFKVSNKERFYLREYYGVVRLVSTNPFFNGIRIYSSGDINTLKSWALNKGYKVDWESFNLAYRIMSQCETNGYPLVRSGSGKIDLV